MALAKLDEVLGKSKLQTLNLENASEIKVLGCARLAYKEVSASSASSAERRWQEPTLMVLI